MIENYHVFYLKCFNFVICHGTGDSFNETIELVFDRYRTVGIPQFGFYIISEIIQYQLLCKSST